MTACPFALSRRAATLEKGLRRARSRAGALASIKPKADRQRVPGFRQFPCRHLVQQFSVKLMHVRACAIRVLTRPASCLALINLAVIRTRLHHQAEDCFARTACLELIRARGECAWKPYPLFVSDCFGTH